MISNQNKIADKTFYLDKTNFMNMSAEENIVFFMVDSIESDYMT